MEIRYTAKYYIVGLIFLCASCRGQQIVQTPSDLKKLEINQHKYIGKSMSFLLKEIKPPIKYVSGVPGQGVRPNAFIFSFVPFSDRDKYKRKGKFPPTIIVYVKESFEWYESRKKLDNTRRFEWSKEDEERYGNLTVDSVAVLYENETLE